MNHSTTGLRYIWLLIAKGVQHEKATSHDRPTHPPSGDRGGSAGSRFNRPQCGLGTG
jgi:hypothetical protein